jgi:hypothetical protein
MCLVVCGTGADAWSAASFFGVARIEFDIVTVPLLIGYSTMISNADFSLHLNLYPGQRWLLIIA